MSYFKKRIFASYLGTVLSLPLLGQLVGFSFSVAACAADLPTEDKKPDDAASKAVSNEDKRDKLYKEGWGLIAKRHYPKAMSAFQEAIDTGFDNGEAQVMLGYCLEMTKKYSKALEQYNDVAKNAKLISVQRKGAKLARTLDCKMRGICPGNCLKPSMKGWRKMDVPGKPKRLYWMVYPYLDPAGKGGSEYWSNDHMGEVIEYVKGRPVNRGKCKICGGTGKVAKLTDS